MKIETWSVAVVAGALLLLCQTVSCLHINSAKSTRNLKLYPTTDSESLAVQPTEVILPQGKFRDTDPGELSVTSFNILAPSYHWLGLEQEEKDSRIQHDRQHRVPMAIDMAKQTNADILCMQEVEGGATNEALLKEVLAKPCDGDHPGYDSHLWSALHPNRKGDVVGLCVAWRSATHNLISADCFRRGMVVQMEEVETGATFCIGNVHLPAKPAAIEGRLKSISTTIKSMEGCETPRHVSALDGAMIVAGDFNCDQKSVTAKLLETGSAPYGTVRDRNYKAKISKNAAFGMKHRFRFKDIYANGLREQVAPVTVSLSGRGPGCMDQIFYASRDSLQSSSGGRRVPSVGGQMMGKRAARKYQAIQRVAESKVEQPSPLRIESVLATVDPDDSVRTQTIMDGLPNVEAGFPSDHVPVGALFAPASTYNKDDLNASDGANHDDEEEMRQDLRRGGGVSANARRRREAYARSLIVRRRHNAILREVSEWLISRGAQDVVRDQPLFKWKWVDGIKKLGRKLRAPDLCCVIEDKLVIVEVTVAHKPDEMRRQKIEKYKDLEELLRTAPVVTEASLEVQPVFVVLMEEDGEIPDATRQDLYQLAALSTSQETSEEDGKLFCNHLQRVFAEYNNNLVK